MSSLGLCSFLSNILLYAMQVDHGWLGGGAGGCTKLSKNITAPRLSTPLRSPQPWCKHAKKDWVYTYLEWPLCYVLIYDVEKVIESLESCKEFVKCIPKMSSSIVLLEVLSNKEVQWYGDSQVKIWGAVRSGGGIVRRGAGLKRCHRGKACGSFSNKCFFFNEAIAVIKHGRKSSPFTQQGRQWISIRSAYSKAEKCNMGDTKKKKIVWVFISS